MQNLAIKSLECIHLMDLIYAMPGYVVLVNKSQDRIYCNDDVLKLLAIESNDLHSISPDLLFGQENRSRMQVLYAALEESGRTSIELDYESPARVKVTLRFLFTQTLINGEAFVLGTGQDITDHKLREVELEKRVADEKATNEQTNKELKIATDRALSANRAKSGFLANMSHELRTPLNAVIGYSEILLEDIDVVKKDQLQADLDRIRKSGRHLLELINDVLDLSKIEAGKMNLNLEYFRVDSVLLEVFDTITPMAAQNKTRISHSSFTELGVMLSDVTKIRQIMFNLISNAIKFSENGEVKVEATKYQLEKQEFMNISVTDNGIGMTEEQLEKLFIEFYQSDESKKSKWKGTGLGLVISDRFAKMMGGHIDVSSEHGKGSKFSLIIPTNTAKIRFQDSPDGFIVGPKVDPKLVRFGTNNENVHKRSKISKVLVIDDDPSVRDLMERYLSREGFEVMAVDNGQDGIARIAEYQPDVITLDVLMPVMDGWSVLTELKKNPATEHIPVIMLSMLDEYDMSYALGASDYLLKPIKRDLLVETVLKHLRDRKDCTVLVVDDQEENRQIVTRILQNHDIKCVEAKNGIDALNKMHDMVPHLILLDLMMPEMDGFKFSEEVKKKAEWREIPIIVITARELSNDDIRRLNGNVERIFERNNVSFENILLEVQNMITAKVRKSDF